MLPSLTSISCQHPYHHCLSEGQKLAGLRSFQFLFLSEVRLYVQFIFFEIHIHTLSPFFYWVACLVFTSLQELPEYGVPYAGSYGAHMSHDTPSYCFPLFLLMGFCHTLIFICSNLAMFFFMESTFFILLEKVLLFYPKVVQMFSYISLLCILFFYISIFISPDIYIYIDCQVERPNYFFSGC